MYATYAYSFSWMGDDRMKAEKVGMSNARVLGPHQHVIPDGFQWYRCVDCGRDGLFSILADDRACTPPVLEEGKQSTKTSTPVAS